MFDSNAKSSFKSTPFLAEFSFVHVITLSATKINRAALIALVADLGGKIDRLHQTRCGGNDVVQVHITGLNLNDAESLSQSMADTLSALTLRLEHVIICA